MNRRNMMMMTGLGALAAAVPLPRANAAPADAQTGAYLFQDEFDGPPGSAPDPAKWIVWNWDEEVTPPIPGHYVNDRRNVFIDGNSNLVIRATQRDGEYYSGKLQTNFRSMIGQTWEARIKFDCLTTGCWPAFWLLNEDPLPDGEIDIVEWYGNGQWPPGSTIHARSDGHTWETKDITALVDSAWHTWRIRWDDDGFKFWRDYVDGAEPYFHWPNKPIRGPGNIYVWPFDDPGYWMFGVLNIAVGGPGAGDPNLGNFPAEMLVDYVRVW